jgi:putative ABC transport system permease protein
MSRLSRLTRGFRGLLRRTQVEQEMDEELRSYLEAAAAENRRAGMSPEEATRAARVAFGSVESVKDQTRDVGWESFVDTLWQDLRYATRTLRKAPVFTLIAVGTLAVGIGANTAIFTIVNAVLIERLPYANPDRIVAVWETNTRRPGRPNVVAPANFIRWGERATAFESLAGLAETRMNLTDAGEPQELVAQNVTAQYFFVLGVSPMLGRVFTADEAADPQGNAVVLAYDVWQHRFGSDPSIVGRTIRLNTRQRTVVGVMPPGFKLFLKSGSLVGKPVELWVPFVLPADARQPRGRYLSAVARLKPGISIEQARAQMDAIAVSLSNELPQFDTGWGVMVVPLHEELAGELRPALLVLTGAVAFVLLIACANVANLLLARGVARQREIAIRAALGAGRARVVRQLLTESLVLGLLGGGFGLLVGRWSLALLVRLSPVDVISLSHIGLSYAVLGFTATVSILTAVICGFAPAFEGARTDVQEALKDGGRQVGAGVRHRRVRHGLVAAEVALAVVLLVGAGLMLRSFEALLRVNPGFDADGILTMRMQLPGAKYDDDAQRIRFFHELTTHVGALAGVWSAGVVSYLPLAGLGAATGFTIEGEPPPVLGQAHTTDVAVCDTGYFRTMNVPLRRGRFFSEREMLQKSNVLIVNEALVRQYFPHDDPLGKHVTIAMTDPNVPTEIIGVVGDTKFVDLATPARPTSYWPHAQLAYGAMTLTVRTGSDPLAFASVVEREVHALDKDEPVSDVRTMNQWVARSLGQARFSSTLLAAFAVLALLVAAIGIYGVMSYAVSQRTSEIGVRVALGADKRDIVRLIVGSGVRTAGLGLAVGVALATILSRTVTTLLFDIAGTDPLTFSVVVALLGAVALAASYIPARRAAHISPVDALRAQ